MNKKIIVAVLLSVLMIFCSVGVTVLADEQQSPWGYTYDFITNPAEWIYQYLMYNTRYDMQTKSNKIDYGNSMKSGIEETTTIIPNPYTGEDEIESFNINENYSISGKFVTISANGNKILYEISLTGYNYKLTSAPSASSDLWDKGGKVVLKKTDMNTGLSSTYSFPAVLRLQSGSPVYVYPSTSTTNRNGLPSVITIYFYYKESSSSVRSGYLVFGQNSENTIQIYDFSNTNYNDVTSGYSFVLNNCSIDRSTGSGSSSYQVGFCLSSLDTNDSTNASLVNERYFGGNFGLAPVFIDTTYSAGSVYNSNNIAPELGFNYINGQLELDADILGAKIDLVLDHLIDLYNDFYSNQTAPYTSITEGDTYNYIEIIQEQEEPVTYPPSTGGGGGVPDEWLQHYPAIETTPDIIATVPDLSYFEENAVVPPATVTLFDLISDFVVDGGFLGLFSITFILGISMYFFRR